MRMLIAFLLIVCFSASLVQPIWLRGNNGNSKATQESSPGRDDSVQPDDHDLGRENGDSDESEGSGDESYSREISERRAVCRVKPDPVASETQQIMGVVNITEAEKKGLLRLDIKLGGFDTTDEQTLHGFHVHESGDVGEGCVNAGGHYDPLGNPHGSPYENWRKRHAGDFGNIEEDEDGAVEGSFVTTGYLSGPYSIAGRAIVNFEASELGSSKCDRKFLSAYFRKKIHAGEDDLGKGGNEESLKTGNAGARLACCAIVMLAD